MIPQYYSIKDLANIYRTSSDLWRKKIANGEIKAVRIGRIIRIPESEVNKVVKDVESISDVVEKILLDKPEITHL